MADAQARRAAIKKATEMVRTGGVFARATSTSKVTGTFRKADTRTTTGAHKRA